MDSKAPTSKTRKRLKRGLSSLNSASHPGPERLFAEVRRRYRILWGREAVRHHQRRCIRCRRWREWPEALQMADLLPSEQMSCVLPQRYGLLWTLQRSNWAQDWKEVEDSLEMFYYPHNLDTPTIMDTPTIPFLTALRQYIPWWRKLYEPLCHQDTELQGRWETAGFSHGTAYVGFEEVKVGSERRRTCSCSSRMQRRYCHWPQGRKGNARFLYGCHECVRALRTKYKEWQLTRSLNKAFAPGWAYFVGTDHQGLQRKGHLLWGRH